MLKRILIFIATFAVALGGATALVVMRTKPAPAAAKAAADSSAKTAGHDSASAAASPPTSDSAKTVKDSTPVARSAAMPPIDSVRPVAGGAAARDSSKAIPASAQSSLAAAQTPAIATSAPQMAPVSSLLAGGRLSKIFGAMSPKDAAKVLQQMDDPDIKEILGRLNDKKAAEILALLPAARAAVISKAAFTAPGSNK